MERERDLYWINSGESPLASVAAGGLAMLLLPSSLLKFNTLLLLKAERSPEDISFALAFAFFYRLHVAYER